MTLGEFRALFLARLNRQDCTTDLTDGFIGEALARLNDEVRAPFMERVHFIDVVDNAMESFVLPTDYLEQIEVLVGTTPLSKLSYREALRKSASQAPAAYARYGNTIYLRGACPPDTRTQLLYYGSLSPIADDADTNEVLTSSPRLLLYAALSTAGDHFQHEKTGEWETRYRDARDALNQRALNDETAGGPMAIAPLYYDPGTGD